MNRNAAAAANRFIDTGKKSPDSQNGLMKINVIIWSLPSYRMWCVRVRPCVRLIVLACATLQVPKTYQ